MANIMEAAFNAAGLFVIARPELIERARREMRAYFRGRRRARVAAAIRAGYGVREDDLAFAVREMSARVSLTRGHVILPGMPGWVVAGKHKLLLAA